MSNESLSLKLNTNLNTIKNSLASITENKFISFFNDNMNLSGKITDSEIHELKLLYSDVKEIYSLVAEQKNKFLIICNFSLNSENEPEGSDFLSIFSAYTYLMQIIIEYNYKKDDGLYIKELIYPIARMEGYNNLYVKIKGFIRQEQYLTYLFVKDHFLNEIIRKEYLILKDELVVFDEINNNLNAISKENNKIILKLNEYGFKGKEIEKEFLNRLSTIIDNLEFGILGKIKVVESLDDKVNELNDNLTFIGLENAYKKFGNQKRVEKENARRMLKLSTPMIFLPIICNLIFLWRGMEPSVFGYMLTATATLIFLYFFKIILQNYLSLKAELTQINLRRSLCMFIQGYTEFAERNKEHQSLSKFESLMFSNVIPDTKQIPSTLDGVEQLAKLFESIRR